MNDASEDLIALHRRMQVMEDVWSSLSDALQQLARSWEIEERQLALKFVRYLPVVQCKIDMLDSDIQIKTTYSTVTFRRGDPLGHISAHYIRQTSFGLDHVLVLYAVSTESNRPTITRINDLDVVECTQEEVIETVRKNLLQPKVLPFRVKAAMTTMNSG